MYNPLIMGRISVVAVWVIFWMFMAAINMTRKNEVRAAFSGVKKMLSATVGMFLFFTTLIFVLYQDGFTMLNTVTPGWQFTWQLLGYAMLLSGFILAMWVAWSLQKPVASPKFIVFQYLRNMMYGSVLLIAFGSSVIFLNPIALTMAILLIPLILYRVKIENEANANI